MASPTIVPNPAPADAGVDDGRDATLDEAFARGDHRAVLTHLMRLHGEEVLRFCISMLGEMTIAEDTRQAVFVDAYQSLSSYQGSGSLRGWLYGIARHRCLDAEKAWRRRRTRLVLDPEAGHQQEDPRGSENATGDQRIDQPRRAAALRMCLRALDAGVRVAVLLRYEEGLPYEEISRLTRERPATLQARVARALPRLRDCLESKGITA